MIAQSLELNDSGLSVVSQLFDEFFCACALVSFYREKQWLYAQPEAVECRAARVLE